MNKLKDSICYLIGPIDDCENQGVVWRRTLIQECKDIDLGIKFLDPTNKLTGLGQDVGVEQDRIKMMKKNNQWQELRILMKDIVRKDHKCVDLSDFVIMYVNPEVHMCGSYFELQSALTEKMPYFIIVAGGKDRAPNWLFGILDYNFMFDDISSVVDRLVEINKGAELSDRWVLIRDQLKEL